MFSATIERIDEACPAECDVAIEFFGDRLIIRWEFRSVDGEPMTYSRAISATEAAKWMDPKGMTEMILSHSERMMRESMRRQQL